MAAATLLRAAEQQERMALITIDPTRSELLRQAAEQRAQAEAILSRRQQPACAPLPSEPPAARCASASPAAAPPVAPSEPIHSQAVPPNHAQARELSEEAARHRSSAATLQRAASQQEHMAGMLGGTAKEELLAAASLQAEQARQQVELAAEKERKAQQLGRSPPATGGATATAAAVAPDAAGSSHGEDGDSSCLSRLLTKERAAVATATAIGVALPFGLITGGLAMTAAPYISSVTGIGDATAVKRHVGATLRRDSGGAHARRSGTHA